MRGDVVALLHHGLQGVTSDRCNTDLVLGALEYGIWSAGGSYDKALMENFFSTLRIELVYRNSWRTGDEAENSHPRNTRLPEPTLAR